MIIHPSPTPTKPQHHFLLLLRPPIVKYHHVLDHQSPFEMRRMYLKVWRGIPCSGRKCLRTESQRDIAEILESKLATIIEEDMDANMLLTPYNELKITTNLRSHEESGGGNKQRMINKIKMGRCFKSELNLRGLYELLVAGFSSKLGSTNRLTSFAVIRK